MRYTALLLLLLCSAALVSAEEKSFSLTGTPTRPGRMMVRLALHSADMKAIRVYAQPSNTLLALFLNEAGPEPVSQSAWWKRTFPRESRPQRFPAAWFEFQAGARVTMSTEAPQPDDTALAIYVHRGGDAKEELLIVETNPREFEYTK